MNAGCLVVYTGGRNNHTFRHAERLLRMALDQLLSLARGRGRDVGTRADAPGLRKRVELF